MKTRHRVPAPRRHTDLSRVTCPECWREIRKMADEVVYRAATPKGGA